MTPRARWKIALVAVGAVAAYLPTIATPPANWWSWTLLLVGVLGAVANAVRALFDSSVTDEQRGMNP